MRSQTQNTHGAQCTNFHLRRGCNVIILNNLRESGEYVLIPTRILGSSSSDEGVFCFFFGGIVWFWHALQIRGINYLMRSRRILDRNEIKKNSRSGENTLIKIFKSALFYQELHFWDYKHNVTRVSD